jgi:hypothetical protein
LGEDSGFCVLRVKARGQRDLVTIVGHAAAIGAGEFVQASRWWINERALAWFARFRWLIVRYERRLDILLGFQLFAADLVCLRIVARWPCQAF